MLGNSVHGCVSVEVLYEDSPWGEWGPLHGASLGSSPPAVRPGTQGTPLMGGSDVLEAGGEKWGGGNRSQCSEHLREWYLS